MADDFDDFADALDAVKEEFTDMSSVVDIEAALAMAVSQAARPAAPAAPAAEDAKNDGGDGADDFGDAADLLDAADDLAEADAAASPSKKDKKGKKEKKEKKEKKDKKDKKEKVQHEPEAEEQVKEEIVADADFAMLDAAADADADRKRTRHEAMLASDDDNDIEVAMKPAAKKRKKAEKVVTDMDVKMEAADDNADGVEGELDVARMEEDALATPHKRSPGKKEKKEKKDKKDKKEKKRRIKDEPTDAYDSHTPRKPATVVIADSDDEDGGAVATHVVSKDLSARELAMSALYAGLPGRFMTTDERQVFRMGMRQLTEQQTRFFLYTRNVLLKAWEADPTRNVYTSAIKESCDTSQLFQVPSVFRYLERHGYINYGYCKQRYPVQQLRKRVCVVGAGLSGLVAAQQLQRAGFEVVVLEASAKVGGRCGVGRLSDGTEVPLGAPSRYDLPELQEDEGDDAMSQVSQETEKLIDVDAPIDQLDNLSRVSATPPPGGEMLDDDRGSQATPPPDADGPSQAHAPVTQKDKDEGRPELRNWRKLPYSQEQAVLHTLLKQVGVNESWWFHNDEYHEDGERVRNPDSLTKPCYFSESGNFMDLADPNVLDSIIRAETALSDFVQLQSDDNGMYLCTQLLKDAVDAIEVATTDVDREQALRDGVALCQQIAQAELESHAPIDRLGKGAFDRDVGRGAVVLPKHWNALCKHLTKKLDIRYDARVREVKYTDRNVSVAYAEGKRGKEKADTYDFCVMTAPLGVLKLNTEEGGIRFNPPLPREKQEAIKEIGFGVRNTMVLEFEEAFWVAAVKEMGIDDGQGKCDLYLQRGPGDKNRGVGVRGQFELNPPHVILSLSGASAQQADEGSESALTMDALDRLHSMFYGKGGVEEIPTPKKVIISRWGAEEFSRGSAPYCGPRTSQAHFAALAAPVGSGGAGPLYFAGDATNHRYHGLLLGAAMSGLRAASELMTHYEKLLETGAAKRPMATLQDRLSQLLANGAAPRAAERDPILTKKKPVNAEQQQAEVQKSLGSSRNIAARYAKREAKPTLQKHLFNAAIAPQVDMLVDKKGYINKAAAAMQIKGQKGLQRLEKWTELRWQEARIMRERELAQNLKASTEAQAQARNDVGSSQGSKTTDKAQPTQTVRTHAQDPKIPKAYQCYSSTNAVDDIRPTWYYQGGLQNEPRAHEFAGKFFKGTATRQMEKGRELLDEYEKTLHKIVGAALARHADAAKARKHGFSLKFYAIETFDAVRDKIAGDIMKKFQHAVALHNKGAFDPRKDVPQLPKLTEDRVRASVLRAVDKAVEGYADPQKDAIVRQLGYDPANATDVEASTANLPGANAGNVDLAMLTANNEIAVARPSDMN